MLLQRSESPPDKGTNRDPQTDEHGKQRKKKYHDYNAHSLTNGSRFSELQPPFLLPFLHSLFSFILSYSLFLALSLSPIRFPIESLSSSPPLFFIASFTPLFPSTLRFPSPSSSLPHTPPPLLPPPSFYKTSRKCSILFILTILAIIMNTLLDAFRRA